MKKVLLALLFFPACSAFAQSETKSNSIIADNETFSVSAFYGAFTPSYGVSTGFVGASLTLGYLYLDGSITPNSFDFGGSDANSYNVHLGFRFPVRNLGLTPVVGFTEIKPEEGKYSRSDDSVSSIDYGMALDYHPTWQKNLKFCISMTKYNCYAGIGFYL